MVRTQLYLTEEQHRRLKVRAATAGRTLSDEVREAVDEHLAGEAGERDRRRAARVAFVEEMRRRPAWVREETGEEYVERIRAADATRQAELDAQWHAP